MFNLKKYNGKKITVAVSGGLDSTALLYFLKEQEKKWGYHLSALHVEHGIRGEESKEDAKFVQEVCAQLSVPLYLFEIDCLKRAKEEKISVETAGREGRREIYVSLVESGKTDYIATAHHVADEAETLLFRLCRGTSLSGACGMREEEGFLIRPFLTWTKEEIVRYAKEIPNREDSTNASLEYTRNKIRLEVLPKLEELCHGATENIAKFSFLAQEDEKYLLKESEKFITTLSPQWAGDTGIRITFTKEKPLFYRAVVLAMKRLGIEKDYTAVHLQDVYSLMEKQTGSKISLKNGVVALRYYDAIAFEREEGVDEWEVLFLDEPTKGEGVVLSYDKDALPEKTLLRTAKEGDTFRKFGGKTKSLKKYFIEKKIPQGIRKTIPLLVGEKDDNVYAVCGVEIADEMKVTKTTKRIGYIVLQKKK